MRAIAKTAPGPGVSIIECAEPSVKPGHVKVRIEGGSICGTDLHIYKWDAFSSARIHPPRIIGHEFCGEIIEVGEGVDASRIGQFISSESHVVCGKCKQCLAGDAHVCVNTTILGIDIEGGFAGYAVIPADNARITPPGVPREVASMMDALGNGVHTTMAGPVTGQTILITGLGPIGLFAVAVCKALGAEKIIATEIKQFRKDLGVELGADLILDPAREDVSAILSREVPSGVDGTLEMSGHPSALSLAVKHTRPGGRVSLLGLFADPTEPIPMNDLVMKGLEFHGIVGRRLWKTWDQMTELLTVHKLDVTKVVTHRLPFTEADQAFKILGEGMAGKVVLDFSDAR